MPLTGRHLRVAALAAGFLLAMGARVEAAPRKAARWQVARTPGGRLTVNRGDRAPRPPAEPLPPGADQATFYGLKLRTPGLVLGGSLGVGLVKVRLEGKSHWRLAFTRGFARASKEAYRGGADPGWLATLGSIQIAAEPLALRAGAPTAKEAIRHQRATFQQLDLVGAFGFSQLQSADGRDVREGNSMGLGPLGLSSGVEKTHVHSVGLTRPR